MAQTRLDKRPSGLQAPAEPSVEALSPACAVPARGTIESRPLAFEARQRGSHAGQIVGTADSGTARPCPRSVTELAARFRRPVDRVPTRHRALNPTGRV
jgi:hypothetical protein